VSKWAYYADVINLLEQCVYSGQLCNLSAPVLQSVANSPAKFCYCCHVSSQMIHLILHLLEVVLHLCAQQTQSSIDTYCDCLPAQPNAELLTFWHQNCNSCNQLDCITLPVLVLDAFLFFSLVPVWVGQMDEQNLQPLTALESWRPPQIQVWGAYNRGPGSPQWEPGAEPLVRWSRGQSPPEAETLLVFGHSLKVTNLPTFKKNLKCKKIR